MTSDLIEIRTRVRAFVGARAWQTFHTPKNLAMALTGEVGELVELLQWLTPDEAAAAGSDDELRPALEDELADVLIYLVSLADSLDIDLATAAFEKVARNEVRFPLESPPSRS